MQKCIPSLFININGSTILCINIQGWNMHYKSILKNVFLLKYNLTINLTILPKLFITKQFLYLHKGHHKNDEAQQSNIVI
jgi:hypothetical protein